MKKTLFVLIITGILLCSFSCKPKAIYQDPSRSVEERVEDLLQKMTLDEKLSLLSGDTSGFDTKGIPRLNIPPIHITDGPLGVRWGKATSFPAGVAFAATWDTILIQEISKAMALETKARGRDYLLGPCVGIHRMPLGGRNFESYSEDPFLASRMAVNWIKALQQQGVIASVKHFATNDQEWMRNDYDVIVDERALREIHLAPFEAAVKEADVWTVMAAYNKQNGQHCTENHHLLKDILKNEWGFKGFVISDWVSVYSTVDAANAGLDLEMPLGIYFHSDSLKKYIENGSISQEVIDDKVRRILRAAFLAGLFDKPKHNIDTTVFEQHKSLAYKAAIEAITLLKNENNILPLDIQKIKTIAVIGPNARDVAIAGGGSSYVNPYYEISPLEGIKKRMGDRVKVVYATGDSIPRPEVEPANSELLWSPDKSQNGLVGEYFTNKNLEGKPILTQLDSIIDFDFGVGSPNSAMIKPNFFSIRWNGYLKVSESGTYSISTLSDDGVRVYLNDKLVIDNWTNHGPTLDQYFCKLEKGKFTKIRLEFYEDGGGAVIKLGVKKLADATYDPIAEAAKIASTVDVAIVFAGANAAIEGEGRDRDGLELPGKQESLIQAVANANPNTIVVLNGGTPVITSGWLNKIKALIHMYYLGQETGNAIAAVLVGDVNPSGKLPFSFIANYNQSPAFDGYKNKNLKVEYKESIFVGYRYLDKFNINPTFPFGFGLSYTSFNYDHLKIEEISPYHFHVTVDITNIGSRDGDEIVQLYLSALNSQVPRPIKELKGFARVSLKAGETKTIHLNINKKDFSYWDFNANTWKVERGIYEIGIGKSSRDIVLKEKIEIK